MTKNFRRKKLIILSVGIIFSFTSIRAYAEKTIDGQKDNGEATSIVSEDVTIHNIYKTLVDIKDIDTKDIESDKDKDLENENPKEDKSKEVESKEKYVDYEEVGEKSGSYYIKFDANGGYGTTKIEQKIGDRISYPEDPERDEYIFDGWYLDKKLTKEFYGSKELKEDMTVYAKWKDRKIEVKFDSKGGNKLGDIKVINGEQIRPLPKPRKRGYEFRGWYKDAKFTEKFKDNEKVEKNIKLFAKWVESVGNIEVDVEIFDSKGKRKIKKDDFIVNEKEKITRIIEDVIKGEKKSPSYYINEYEEFYSFDNVANTDTHQWNIFINKEKIEYKDLDDHELEPRDKIELIYQWNYIDKYKSMINTDLVGTYINGYSDGTFRPENNITREEIAIILHRIVDEEALRKKADWVRFHDVDEEHWAAEAIQKLTRLSVLNGYESGHFDPKGNVTRGEVAVVLARMGKLKTTNVDSFTDTKDYWGSKEVNTIAEKGWINGYEDGSFRPDENITRGELVAIVNRALGRKRVRYAINPFKDLDVSKWYHEEILKAF